MRFDRCAHAFLSAIQIAAVVIFWIGQCVLILGEERHQIAVFTNSIPRSCWALEINFLGVVEIWARSECNLLVTPPRNFEGILNI